jgi:hypothetical protein
MLLCDRCDHGYHTYCNVPRLEEIPSGNWFCVRCVEIVQGKQDRSLRTVPKLPSPDGTATDSAAAGAGELYDGDLSSWSADERGPSPGKLGNHLSPRSGTAGHEDAMIKVGPNFQAAVPAGYAEETPTTEPDARVGQLSFCPESITMDDIQMYLEGAASTRHPTIFPGDSAMVHLHTHGYNIGEALRKLAEPNGAKLPDTASLDGWSDDEVRRFEEGVVRFGKNFGKIFQFMGKTRPIANLVLFYYVRWKKSPNYKVWQSRWKDFNSDQCYTCSRGGDLLCCDGCPAAYHPQCCAPPYQCLEAVPEGAWYCKSCESRRSWIGLVRESPTKTYTHTARDLAYGAADPVGFDEGFTNSVPFWDQIPTEQRAQTPEPSVPVDGNRVQAVAHNPVAAAIKDAVIDTSTASEQKDAALLDLANVHRFGGPGAVGTSAAAAGSIDSAAGGSTSPSSIGSGTSAFTARRKRPTADSAADSVAAESRRKRPAADSAESPAAATAPPPTSSGAENGQLVAASDGEAGPPKKRKKTGAENGQLVAASDGEAGPPKKRKKTGDENGQLVAASDGEAESPKKRKNSSPNKYRAGDLLAVRCDPSDPAPFWICCVQSRPAKGKPMEASWYEVIGNKAMAVGVQMKQLSWPDQVGKESVLCLVRRSEQYTQTKDFGKKSKGALGPKVIKLSQEEWGEAMESKLESEEKYSGISPKAR